MSIHYKFKSALDFDTLSFDGLHISLRDLKKAILQHKRIGKNTEFDLQITNAQTKEEYTDENTLIPKNTSLIVVRVPLTVQQKRIPDRNESINPGTSKDVGAFGRRLDLSVLDGSEDDKIKAMMFQSTQDYDPSNYAKYKGANQTGEVPPNYRCFKCHQPGHWIKNCPLGSNQELIEIKKSTGIPRSFMVPVDGPSVPGAMMTPTGHYAVPHIDHEAYKEGKKEKPPFAQDNEPVEEKPEIPEDKLCSICKDLLTDAVMIPCCGNSFCDECIRTYLLESEEHECPDCNEKDISPGDLMPNRYLRSAVANFKKETGYAKRPTVKLPPSQTVPEPSKVEQQPESQPPGAASPVKTENQTTESETKYQASSKKVATVDPSNSHVSGPSLDQDVRHDSVPKMLPTDEPEVPPPPGTEPVLPIPSSGSWPEKQRRDRDREHDRDYEEMDSKKDDDYYRDRNSRERRRSFSRDNHRERPGMDYKRVENPRPMSRRRSLSPRNSHQADYQSQGHNYNAAPKNYPTHGSNDSHYPPMMHYDSSMRRPNEDRPGTPTVDEPHLHSTTVTNQPPLLPYPPGEERGPPPQNYSQPPPSTNLPPHNPPLLPDPYIGHRMHLNPYQQGPPYAPPRYERPAYQQQTGGYRPAQPIRNFNGPPRPMRGMHNRDFGYRGHQPPPPGLGRNIHNGNQGVIDDPLEAFERMLREKDERDRRLGKHRRRSRSLSRSRSYSRSRSRSFGRRSPARLSRSRSPLPKRRSSRSPPPLHRRSRSPKRRSRSGSFTISRSRSYSRSQSPRGSLPRDRERDRDRDRDRDRERDRDRDRERDAPARYRSPVRSPPRFHKERERERPRSPYNSYHDSPNVNDYQYRDRERDPPVRERPPPRYVPRTTSVGAPSANYPPSLMPTMAHLPLDRKDYYDTYNRYSSTAPSSSQRYNSPPREPPHKRFDDVAPPGTEGYYDLPPPGVDHPRDDRRDDRREDRDVVKDDDMDRDRNRDDRMHDRGRRTERDRDDRDRPPIKERDDRVKEREERERRERKEREDRHRREDDYEKDRYRDDRHPRQEEKPRGREREKRSREYDDKDRERYERYDHHSLERKRSKKSTSPYPIKSTKLEHKDSSPERSRRKEKEHEEKSEEKKKEKKIKDKKKKKDSDDKKEKKKKKKEKKSLKEAAAKEEHTKVSESDISLDEKRKDDSSELLKVENIKPEDSSDMIVSQVDTSSEFHEKLLVMNPEPPEFRESPSDLKELTNPPNPNFKPIPELKGELKQMETLYDGLGETEIAAVIAEKDSIIGKIENSESQLEDVEKSEEKTSEKSPKKDEFLAPLPEPSKWERDETAEKVEGAPGSPEKTNDDDDDDEKSKVVTSEVLKRAENAIFQKAINAIRPIEIKKISDSRKMLYQNPEPKVAQEDPSRKSVNVTINIGRNERNVEIAEPAKKAKLDRSKFKPVPESSPTRLSAKERLGDKVDDEKEKRMSPTESFPKSENQSRRPERKLSPLMERRIEPPVNLSNSERKVFLDDRKKDKKSQDQNKSSQNRSKSDRGRTPPPLKRAESVKPVAFSKHKEEDEEKRKKEKKREDKKRKKEHRSRSKSKDRKRKKEKKHKKDKEKTQDKKQKHKEAPSKEKEETEREAAENTEEAKKQRRNPKLVSDRKRSLLDEASFEPDYSASESESEEEKTPVKKLKLDESEEKEGQKAKRRSHSSSSEDESSESLSSSSESSSSDESHKKRKKKHKKHKKKKSARRDSSSDSDAYSDSSDSSSDEERHRKKKKSKKSKNKKKKKSKHK